MISGIPPLVRTKLARIKAFVCAAALLIAFFSTPANAETLSLDTVMRNVAARAEGEVRFRETRQLRLLKNPAQVNGTFKFTRPDKLERRVAQPVPEVLTVQGQTLTAERDGKRFSMPLDDSSALGVLIGSLRATLAGDGAALQQQHTVRVSGIAANWALQLTPLAPLDEKVREIKVTGRSGRIQRFDLLEANGDRTLIEIQE